MRPRFYPRLSFACAVACLALVACPPGKSAYLEKARGAVARACCSIREPATDGCSRCPLLEGATVSKEAIEEGCANSCQMVELETRGPNGAGKCTYMISWWNDEWHVEGGCHPL